MKEKGFTLIELLAVIVILAIVALIATPIVLNIIDDSRESAAKISAQNYIRAVNLAIISRQQKSSSNNISDGMYSIMQDGNICLGVYNSNTCSSEILEVDLDGSKPDSGNVYISSNSVFKVYNLKIKEEIVSMNSSGEFIVVSMNLDKWDGTSATTLSNLKIDEAMKTVEVNSAKDLAGVRDAINSGKLTNYKIVLNTSIDLNNKIWTPIGIAATSALTDSDTPFTGTFDGNGYIIKGMKIVQEDVSRSVGFFGTVVGDVTVKNLSLEGTLNSNFKTAAGLIAIAVDDGDVSTNVTIDNVIVDVDVNSADGTGGFIGRTYNSGTTTITNSTNNGTITGPKKVAGFVAYNWQSTLTIKNCTNNGNITGSTNVTGGILAYEDETSNTLIENCVNNGNIIADTSNASVRAIAGGIVGVFKETASYVNKHTGTVKNCVNNGTVTSNNFAGGIIGNADGEWQVLNNTNNGKVNATGTLEGAGGIIGLIRGSCYIEECKNTAELTSNDSIGGIVNRYTFNELNSNYTSHSVIIKNSSGGNIELFKGTPKTKGGVISHRRIKNAYKDLYTITIENSSMNGIDDLGTITYID